MCNFVQAATVDNFLNVTEKTEKVILVKKGTIVECITENAKLSVNNSRIAIQFFAWNAYLKSGKFWAYEDEKKTSKSNIIYSRTYLDVSEVDAKLFKVDDYVFATGSYVCSLHVRE